MWIIEILYFIYILIRLRLEIPFYSQEKYRENVTNWCRRLMKRYNTKIYVHGKPQPGFLVPNHTSYLDTILVLALKAGGAVAKREIKDYLLFGPIGQKLGVLWVKREKEKSRSTIIDQLNNWDAVNKPLGYSLREQLLHLENSILSKWAFSKLLKIVECQYSP